MAASSGATAFKLNCPLEQCRTIKTTAAADIVAGTMAVVENLVGVYPEAVADTAEGVFMYHAPKITVPKSVTSSQNTFSAGDIVYFDAAEAAVCSASSGNIACGVALKDAVAVDTTVQIDLDGNQAN